MKTPKKAHDWEWGWSCIMSTCACPDAPPNSLDPVVWAEYNAAQAARPLERKEEKQ